MQPSPSWILELSAGAAVAVPDGEASGREALIEWIWAVFGDDGLLGVDEGAVDVAAAATAGLIGPDPVLDAAEAPIDRDWVAAMPLATIACWFDDEASAGRAAAVLGSIPGCTLLGVRPAPPPSDDDTWRDAFTAIEVPGFGTVRPAWEQGDAGASPGGTTIFIEPGAGFGTGLHETTQLCLAEIAAWKTTGGGPARVLDFGAGSGILAIAAAVLGAPHAEAVEVDLRVHAAIHDNAARNGVAGRVMVSDRLPPPGEAFDLVVANILADVLLAHADDLCSRVRRGPDGSPMGRLVLSGLRPEDCAPVAAAYAARLGSAAAETKRGGWCCLRFARSASPLPGDATCR